MEREEELAVNRKKSVADAAVLNLHRQTCRLNCESKGARIERTPNGKEGVVKEGM